jgi:hypothetical protein
MARSFLLSIILRPCQPFLILLTQSVQPQGFTPRRTQQTQQTLQTQQTPRRDIFPLFEQRIHANLELVGYPNELNPADEVSQNMTASQAQSKRRRGGQKGNRNARKHGFYSGTLSPAETSQLWNITNLEGVDPEIALIRVRLQSSLQLDPGNRRVIEEASRLLVKWYSADYGLDATDRSYLKTVVESLLEIAPLHQSAGLDGSQKQMANGRNESYVL